MAMDKSQAIKIVVAVVALVGAILFFSRNKSTTMPDAAFYYDLSTGDLFPGPFRETPPITAPQGGKDQGARAFVMTCGACSESERQIVYIKTHTPEAKAMLNASPEDVDMNVLQQGTQVAAPPAAGEEPQWVPEAGAMGQQLVGSAQTMCSGGPAKPCRP